MEKGAHRRRIFSRAQVLQLCDKADTIMDTYADSIEHLLEALALRDNITSMFAEPVRRALAGKSHNTMYGDGDEDDAEITTRPDD
jgi:hypothetical protein